MFIGAFIFDIIGRLRFEISVVEVITLLESFTTKGHYRESNTLQWRSVSLNRSTFSSKIIPNMDFVKNTLLLNITNYIIGSLDMGLVK